jgi:hypothetical protein
VSARRHIGTRVVLDGAYSTTYNINTLAEIDGNLEDFRWNPQHPDVDRLLDARAWLLATPVTACLLHADYHRMGGECWGVVLDWQERHQGVPEAQLRNDYQDAVERRILDSLHSSDKEESADGAEAGRA